MPCIQTVVEHDTSIGARVSKEMAEKLKDYAASLSKQFGVKVTIGAAVRRLLADGLERAGFPVGEQSLQDDPDTKPRSKKR